MRSIKSDQSNLDQNCHLGPLKVIDENQIGSGQKNM